MKQTLFQQTRYLLALGGFSLATLLFASCNEDDDNSDITPNPIVVPSPTHKADAGPDQTIRLPVNSVILDGSNSTSPSGALISYEWTKVFGSDYYRIINKKSAKAQIVDLFVGAYTFVLSVSDALNRVSRDTVIITVLPPEFVSASCDNSNRPIFNSRLLPIGTLPEARGGLAIASAGNKILFAGASLSSGGVNGYGSAQVDIYDIPSNTWSTARLSETRSDIAAVAAGKKIFFAGGRLGDGAFDMLFSTVDIYDTETGNWSVASLSQPRTDIAAVALGDKVFFAGGEYNWNYDTSNNVDIYDVSTGQWSTASLSEPRSHISAVAVNNKVYFAGGQKEDRWYYSPSSTIDVYDNTTNTWSTASLSQPMGFLDGLAVGDNIFWLGECTMEKKNVNTGESSIEELFKPGSKWLLKNHAVIKNNKLLFFRNEGEDSNRFDIYDLNTHTWSIGVLPQDGITFKSIISVNNTIYFAGGMMEGAALSNQVWKLEL